MKKSVRVTERILAVIMTAALVLSVCAVPTFAAEASGASASAASFVNTSGDGGDHVISLSASRTFKAYVPVNMTEAEAKETAKTAVWSILRDKSRPYADVSQYPNQYQGGTLDSWICTDNETKLFTDIVSGAETKDGQVYLTLTFGNNCYFYDKNGNVDLSVPHSNGGAYLDVSGYFNLTVKTADKTLGSVALKITPYDNFHTMSEIYDEIDEIVDFAADKTDLYVEKFSMGKSQGDNGLASLDMPYLIVAKDKSAVERWKSIKEEAETNPSDLLKKN